PLFCCSRIARQRFVRGSRQWTHSRHCGENRVTTWSPGRTEVTPSPTRSTIPAPSCPSTVGAYPDGSAPDAVYRSVWHTPQATSRTSASSAFGSASSTSCTLSGAPNSSSTAALIRTPPPPVATTARAYRGARERGRPPAWCARPWLPAERARARVLRGEANRYGDAAEHDRRDTA